MGRREASLVALGLALAACGEPRTGYDAQSDNPLGPSFWMVPTPSDDDSLLSRTFVRPPDGALSLEEQSMPNPCAAHLGSPHAAQMPNHYENAVATLNSAQASAVLSLYGFDARASSATHLLYKVSTSAKVTRLDTPEYLACCQQHDCGWGYVQSLIFGEGEYAAGAEVSAEARGNYTVVNGRSARSFQVKETKAIKGYIAALIVAHDRNQAVQACPPDQEWAKFECAPKGQMVELERLCRYGKPEASSAFWADNPSMLDLYREQQAMACTWVARHGGPNIAPPAAAEPPSPTAP